MIKNIQAIRGMSDIMPEATPHWQYIEEVLKKIAWSYGYQEIRFPIIERTELFERCIGTVTDIVTKEMYTFVDRNGDNLTLRPEGTVGCVRASIQHGVIHNQVRRLWYLGPMFRHERPQKGRYRQFHQFGVETFGLPGPDIDAEHIFMMNRLWNILGISDQIVLQINSLGTKDTRSRYRDDLVIYFKKNIKTLDEDSKRRLDTNPLRILDSKNPDMQSVIMYAPKLLDYLDEDSRVHFDNLKRLLDAAQIRYKINPRLVRGLDYYCFTVYEWVAEKLGAQNALCAGGRYDNLVAQLGGKSTPASGFALGLERLAEIISTQKTVENIPDVFLITVGETAKQHGLLLAEQLRDKLPKMCIITSCSSGGFKTQFKRADKSDAKVALILGDKEIEQEIVTVKYLREDKPQMNLKFSEVVKLLSNL
ncbi:MAG: histidinol dehydrogenase [Coxiella sp. DG_40]|nr:MAG: histidinol dehydrogenase [Coxiella sp. DG_40]